MADVDDVQMEDGDNVQVPKLYNFLGVSARFVNHSKFC